MHSACVTPVATEIDFHHRRILFMARFQVGVKVRISGPITTKHRDREATVLEVRVSRHSRPGVTSLDKYVVQFEDGIQAEFFDIQLAADDAEADGIQGSFADRQRSAKGSSR